LVDWVKSLSKVLYIDLTRKIYWTENREDLFSKWLGGIGVATQLYKEEVPKGADPLGPDNVVIFAVGPLTGAYPLGSKTVAVFKSPLNGYFAESHAGGRSAVAIRYAGYGAIVIKGKSDRPVYIIIDDDKIRFRDGAIVWGMRSTETVGRILREVAPGPGHRSIMRIGRAGENLVRYASVITETYRHFGRMGLGAVLGSKKLKALVIVGRKGFKAPNITEYRTVYKELYDIATKSTVMQKYHDLGTPANVLPLNVIGGLPTRNFRSGQFEGAEQISGEKMAETVLIRRVACGSCPTACIHIAGLREEYPDEKFFYKIRFISYDYELVYALGSNLGVSDRNGLLRLIDAVESEGLDAISTGVALSWATEAYEEGIISDNETLVPLEWGNADNYVKAIHYIVKQPNEFYKTLALGAEEAAKKYGGLDYALAFNKVEPAGYHTGPLFFISLLVGSRHSHLDAGGYSMDQKLTKAKAELPPPDKAIRMIAEEEAWRQVLNSLVICLFSRGLYKPEIIVKALKPLGYQINEKELIKLGKLIYAEKHSIKVSEGYDPLRARIPKRILETPTPLSNISEDYIKEAVKHYTKIIVEYSGLK
jgi:aldehyde:ferredoxin oxidoreductase